MDGWGQSDTCQRICTQNRGSKVAIGQLTLGPHLFSYKPASIPKPLHFPIKFSLQETTIPLCLLVL